MLKKIAPLAFCGMILAFAGCVSGQVTDTRTGKPIEGATVTFHDSLGNSGTVTTGPGGIYRFDGVTSPQPAPGPVTFEVTAPGYFPLTVKRDVQYDDNAEHTWALENFLLVLGCG